MSWQVEPEVSAEPPVPERPELWLAVLDELDALTDMQRAMVIGRLAVEHTESMRRAIRWARRVHRAVHSCAASAGRRNRRTGGE